MSETIYLSGPMTGRPDNNSAVFAHYAAKYRALGFIVLSPPELDAAEGNIPTYVGCLRRDVDVLLNRGVTRMYMLPEWEVSRGARLERHIAESIDITVYDAETGKPLPEYFRVPTKVMA